MYGDILNKIQDQILKLKTIHDGCDKVVIVGDFNARVGL